MGTGEDAGCLRNEELLLGQESRCDEATCCCLHRVEKHLGLETGTGHHGAAARHEPLVLPRSRARNGGVDGQNAGAGGHQLTGVATRN